MTGHNLRIGKKGEDLARDYLTSCGMILVAANYRTPEGEIDLICRKDDVLHFVEVKTRTTDLFGYPEESVDFHKAAHLEAAADAYMTEMELPQDQDWQIHIVAVEMPPGKPVRITWLEDVELDD